MVLGVGEIVVFLVLVGLVVAGGWAVWNVVRRSSLPGGASALSSRERTWLADSIAQARWVAAHDEVDGQTRVLVRRQYTGLDGRPAVAEERVIEAFPAQDPAWEARFTEGMARARFRCGYLNGEESAG
jgi:hypothetical protein